MATVQLGTAIQRGLASAKPASGDATKAGQLYYETDTGKLWHDDGSTWIEAGIYASILAAVAALASNGLIARTGSGTVAARSIAAGTGLAVTNGDGASGNPTIAPDVNGLTADATPDGAADYVMTYDASAAAHKKVLLDNLPGGGGASALDDLTDVNAPAPSNGDVLTWDSTPGEWVAAAPGVGALDLDDLGDVDTTTIAPSDGDVLTWDNGSSLWVPAAPTGGGGGAPTTSQYVTTASDATLTAEVAIPGLAASPDRLAAFGSTISEDYDSGSSGLTWSTAPDTEDVNTTAKSHLYIADNSASAIFGLRSFAPGAAAFDARMHIAIESDGISGKPGVGMIFFDSGESDLVMYLLYVDNYSSIRLGTYQGSGYTATTSVTFTQPPRYIRVTRDASTGWAFWYSTDGLAWVKHSIMTKSLTVAKIGLRVQPGSNNLKYWSDWFRVG